MSCITIEPTEFRDVRTGQIRYGVVVHDDDRCGSEMFWDDIPDDDMKVLERVVESYDNEISLTIKVMKMYRFGCTVGNTYFNWEIIEHLFKDVQDA